MAGRRPRWNILPNFGDICNCFVCPNFREGFKSMANFKIDQNKSWVKFLKELKFEGLKQALKPDVDIFTVYFYEIFDGFRIFWICMTIFMVGLSLGFIGMQLQDEFNNPVIVIKKAKDKQIADILAPALTICNTNLIKKSYYEKAKRCHESINAGEPCVMKIKSKSVTFNKTEIKELFLHLDHRCNSVQSLTKSTTFYDHDANNKVNFEGMNLNVKNIEMRDTETYRMKIQPFLDEATYDCDQLIAVCSWAGQKPTLCEGRFYPIETDAGRCCVHNMMPEKLLKKHPGNVIDENVLTNHTEVDIQKWNEQNIEEDIHKDDRKFTRDGSVSIDKEVPMRQYQTGRLSGFSVILLTDKNEQFCSSLDSIGFQLAVHAPDEIPNVGKSGIFIPLQHEVSISVSAEVRLAESSSLIKVDVEKRGCYMPNELRLDGFNNYTQTNCISECISKVVNEHCNCLMVYMPKTTNKTTGKLCGPLDMPCVELVKTSANANGINQNCSHCKPRCNEVNYDVNRVSSMPLQNEFNFFNAEFAAKCANKWITHVHVFLDDLPVPVLLLKRVNDYWTSLGNTGGILSFTLDISFPRILQMLRAIFAAIFGMILIWYRRLQNRNQVADIVLPVIVEKTADAETQTPTEMQTQTTSTVETQTLVTTGTQTTVSVNTQTTASVKSQTSTSVGTQTDPAMDLLPTVRIEVEPVTPVVSPDRQRSRIPIRWPRRASTGSDPLITSRI